MADGLSSGYAWPVMNWNAPDLAKEWERFHQHCKFVFGGRLSRCQENERICHLMTFVGDKGREKYLCFTWGERNLGTDEAPQMVSEKDIFECVVEKFRAHVESKRNPIRAAFVFEKRIQRPGESFDDFGPPGGNMAPQGGICKSWGGIHVNSM